MSTSARDAVALLGQIVDIGRDPVRGGWSRHVFDGFDLALRSWFERTATSIGLDVERDANANLWAWWPEMAEDTRPGLVLGSHLDSVPGGGAYDGPLGVVSALAAVARLIDEGYRPSAPIAVAVFAEEEGSRFGSACVGSRLMTGAINHEDALALADSAGVLWTDLLAADGYDPGATGPDPQRVARIGAFVELHIEQGAQLAPLGQPIGLGESILAHGRWRLDVRGRGDHAGATELADRRDPVVVAAHAVIASRRAAESADPATRGRATVGRVEILPGGTNVIASSVRVWIDVRAEHDDDVRALVAEIAAASEAAAAAEGCDATWSEESFSARVEFDDSLTDRLDSALGGVPRIPTGAGHDAGVLSTVVPSAMVFVRNPDGVSHAPGEHAEDADVEAGVQALVAIIRELA